MIIRLAAVLLLLTTAVSGCGPVHPPVIVGDRVIPYEPGDVKMQVPQGWRAEREGQKLILEPLDGSIKLIFFAPAERGMEAGMAEVVKTISNRRNTGTDMRSRLIADKMHVQNYYGTGQVNDRPVRWMMTLVDKDTFEEPRLAAVTFGEAKDFESNLPQVLKIMNGLRRI